MDECKPLAGGATTLSIHVLLKNPPDVSPALNGILAGLVSITGPCPVVDGWAAVLIGRGLHSLPFSST